MQRHTAALHTVIQLSAAAHLGVRAGACAVPRDAQALEQQPEPGAQQQRDASLANPCDAALGEEVAQQQRGDDQRQLHRSGAVDTICGECSGP